MELRISIFLLDFRTVPTEISLFFILSDIGTKFDVHITQDEVYSIQHYVIKFVNNLRQVGGFLWVLRFPTPIKLTAAISLKYC